MSFICTKLNFCSTFIISADHRGGFIDFTYYISYEEDYLRVTSEGEASSTNEVNEYIHEVIYQCYNKNMSLLLVDDRLLKYTVSLFDTLKLINTISELMRRKGMIIIARVLSERDFVRMKPVETFCQNRGIELKQFTKFYEAESWLLNT